jgi:hypothetical protein
MYKKIIFLNKILLVLTVSLSVNSKIDAQNSYSISGKINYPGSQEGQLNVRTWPSDSQNKVLNLDGDGDFVETEITDLSGSEITIQYWFKGVSNQSAVRVQSGAGWIVAGWNGKHILHNDDGINGVSIGENYNDGEWHQITLSWKQATTGGFASYVDGQLVDSRDSSVNEIPAHDAPVYIGAFNGVGEYSSGYLDEVAIWNRALTAQEIETGWNKKLSGDEDGLIALWNFDNEEDELLDLSTSGFQSEFGGDAIVEYGDIPKLGGNLVEENFESTEFYLLQNISKGENYTVFAFIDVNSNGIADLNEPYGYYEGKLNINENINDVDILLKESPVIINEPLSAKTTIGEEVVLKVEAAGTAPINYTWKYNNEDIVETDRVNGVSSDTLTIKNFKKTDEGLYKVVLNNEIGNAETSGCEISEFIEGNLLSGQITYEGMIVKNKVLNLDGDGDYVLTPIKNLSGDELTIQYWFRGTSLQSAVRQQSSGWIVAGWNGKHILANDDGVNGIKIGEESLDGNWHHVSLTWKRNSESGFASYLDGELVDSRDSSDVPIPDYDSNVFFGSVNGVGEFSNGQLDEISIWNKALSSEEVKNSFKNSYSGQEDGLMGFWNFDDGTASDITESGFDGTLNGDAKIVDATGVGGRGLVHVMVGSKKTGNLALVLDGDGDFVETPLTDLSGPELSIEYWFKGESNQSAVRQQGGPGWVVAGWSGQHILFNDGGTSGVPIGTDYNNGDWHHIAMTWKQNTENGFASYVDGKLISARNSSDSPIPNINAPIQFGAFLGQFEFAKGELDEIAIWNRARSFGEISSQWNTVLNGTENGLVGFWNFDDGSATDLSPNGYDGTLEGDAIINEATINNLGGVPINSILSTFGGKTDQNKVLNLDGDGDYVSTPISNLSGDELTIQYWFRGTSLQSAVRQQSSGWIVAGWNGKHILANDDGVNGLNIGEDSLDGNWHHVSLTWKRNSESGFASYLDGELVDSRDSSDVTIPDYESNVFFGAFNGAGEFSNGQLDEIAIWNKALSSEEVKNSFKNSYSGQEDGLMGYWNFDDGTASDITESGFNGTLNGDAKIVDAKGGRANPGEFQLLNVVSGEDYVLTSFIDLDGDGKQDANEPFAESEQFNVEGEMVNLNIKLLDPVQIVSHPSSLDLEKSQQMKIKVQVSGTGPFEYTWLKNDKELEDDERINGNDSNELTINNMQLSDSGVYSVIVSSQISQVTSDGALVTIMADNINDGLIGHWKLNGNDEDDFFAIDSSQSFLDAELLEFLDGDPEWWVDGKIDGSLKFTSENKNFLVVSEYEKPSNALTISAWVWASSSEPWGSIFKNWGDGKSGQFHFGLNASGQQLSNYISTSNGKSYSVAEDETFPLESWQHVVTTVDGLAVKIYRNGNLVGSTPYQGSLVENELQSIGIGAKLNDDGSWASNAAGYWNGKMDDIGLWNRALSNAEILGIYQTGLDGNDLSNAKPVETVSPGVVALNIFKTSSSKINLSWSDESSLYILQESSDSLNWINSNAVVDKVGIENNVSILIEEDKRLYRLTTN